MIAETTPQTYQASITYGILKKTTLIIYLVESGRVNFTVL